MTFSMARCRVSSVVTPPAFPRLKSSSAFTCAGAQVGTHCARYFRAEDWEDEDFFASRRRNMSKSMKKRDSDGESKSRNGRKQKELAAVYNLLFVRCGVEHQLLFIERGASCDLLSGVEHRRKGDAPEAARVSLSKDEEFVWVYTEFMYKVG